MNIVRIGLLNHIQYLTPSLSPAWLSDDFHFRFLIILSLENDNAEHFSPLIWFPNWYYQTFLRLRIYINFLHIETI